MAEDTGDKTEAPTPRRREEAREQGQIARSPDLTAAALLLGFLLLMNSFGSGLIRALQALMRELLSPDSLAQFNTDVLGPTLLRTLLLVGGALAPLLLGAIVIAIIVNLIQVGFFFSGKRLQPNFGLINPLKGFSRIFAAEGLMHLAMNLLKLTLVVAIGWSAARDRVDQIIGIQQVDYLQAFGLGASIIYAIGIRIALLLLVLAIIDYGYQKFQTEQQLKMTKQEIKEEMRHMEGDPKIKQRRRQLAQQMLSKRLKRDVPTADVIVTNPTEFAIALKYDAATMHAPKVVAKGRGYMAKRIREIAIEHGFPSSNVSPWRGPFISWWRSGRTSPSSFTPPSPRSWRMCTNCLGNSGPKRLGKGA
jgi:flagellar biosynthetic protein FlhB